MLVTKIVADTSDNVGVVGAPEFIVRVSSVLLCHNISSWSSNESWLIVPIWLTDINYLNLSTYCQLFSAPHKFLPMNIRKITYQLVWCVTTHLLTGVPSTLVSTEIITNVLQCIDTMITMSHNLSDMQTSTYTHVHV